MNKPSQTHFRPKQRRPFVLAVVFMALLLPFAAWGQAVHLEKQADSLAVHAGDTATFTFVITQDSSAAIGPLTLIDTLATGTSYAGSDAGGMVGTVFTVTIPSLAPGETLLVHLAVLVLPEFPYPRWDNRAWISWGEQSLRSRAILTILRSFFQLKLSKVADSSHVEAGHVIGYNITVLNNGTVSTENVTVVDTLPDSTTYVNSVPPAVVTRDPVSGRDIVTRTLPPVHPGEMIDLRVEALVSWLLATDRRIVNWVSGYSGIDTATMQAGPVVILGSNQLRMRKETSTPIAQPGDTVTWILYIENFGTMPMRGVTVSDTLATGTTFLDATRGGILTGDVVRWTLPVIAPRGVDTLRVRVIVGDLAPGSIILNQGFGESPGNDTMTNVVEVHVQLLPRVTFTKIADRDSAANGDTVRFTLTVTNSGTGPADDVVLRDTLPADFVFIASTPPPDSATSRWTLGTIAPGGTGTVEIITVVRDSTGVGRRIVNRGHAVGLGIPALIDSAAVTIFPRNGRVTKSADRDFIGPCDSVTFTLTITNTGPVAIAPATLTDIFDPRLVFRHATPPVTGATYWTFPSLAPGDSRTVTVTFGVDPSIPDSLDVTNRAVFSSTGGTIAEVTLPVHLRAGPALPIIEKWADRDSVRWGETITWTIVVRNAGRRPLPPGELTDTFNTYLTLLDTQPPGTVTGRRITWPLPAMNCGQSDTFRVVTLADSNTQVLWVYENTACWDTSGVTMVCDTATVRMHSRGAISLDKRVSPTGSANRGDTLTYTIVLRNDTLDVIPLVTVVDTLGPYVEPESLGGGAWDPVHRTLTWSFVDYPRGLVTSLVFTVRILATAPLEGVITNFAVGHAGPVVVTSPTTRTPIGGLPAGLVLTKIATPSTGSPGDTIDFRLILRNMAHTPAYRVTLTDLLPIGMTYLSSVPPAAVLGHGMVWTLDSIPGDSALTFHIYAVLTDEAADSLRLTNLAAAWGAYSDTVVASATVYIYHLDLRKTVSRPVVSAGDSFTYIIKAFNHSDIPLRNFTITDSLADSLRLIRGSSTSGLVYDSTTNVVQFLVDVINPGDSVVLRLVVRVKRLPPGLYIFDNWAVASLGTRVIAVSDTASNSVLSPVLELSKIATRTEAEYGDIIPYVLRVINNDPRYTLYQLRIEDQLPRGFKYRPGTSLVDGRPAADPTGSSPLVWALDSIGSKDTVTLVYQVILGLDATEGDGINHAQAFARYIGDLGTVSNPAEARVHVNRDLFSSGEILLGKVWIEADENLIQNAGETGVEGIGLLLEDGQYVRTDKFGKFSFTDVAAGDHVLRLDQSTLPLRVAPVSGGWNNAFEGDSLSQLVRVPRYGMARANFVLKRTGPEPIPQARSAMSRAELNTFVRVKPRIRFRMNLDRNEIHMGEMQHPIPMRNLSDRIFLFARHELKQPPSADLNAIRDTLAQYPGWQVLVECLMDSAQSVPPTYTGKKAFTQARADAVRDFLAETGFPRDHIRAIGLGDSLLRAGLDTTRSGARISLIPPSGASSDSVLVKVTVYAENLGMDPVKMLRAENLGKADGPLEYLIDRVTFGGSRINSRSLQRENEWPFPEDLAPKSRYTMQYIVRVKDPNSPSTIPVELRMHFADSYNRPWSSSKMRDVIRVYTPGRSPTQTFPLDTLVEVREDFAGPEELWGPSLDANQGDTAEYKIRYQSEGDDTPFTLDISLRLDPNEQQLVPGTMTINGVPRRDPEIRGNQLIITADGLINPVDLTILYKTYLLKDIKQGDFRSSVQFNKIKK